MKRVVAVALALALLLTAAFAGAEESMASTLTLRELELSLVREDGVRSVSFEGTSIQLMLGSAGGIPTLQATFSNGEGQQVDAVMQVRSGQLLLSVGGITGQYYYDIAQRLGADYAFALGGVMLLAGGNLEKALDLVTTEDEDGNHSLQVSIPAGTLSIAALGLLGMASSSGAVDLDELRAALAGVGGSSSLNFSYNPGLGRFTLEIVQAGGTVRLEGTMEMSVSPVEFVEVSDEEERYDLMDLDAETLSQLQGELGLIGMKLTHFADGAGLDDMLDY
ncbi:MAG: hypothetical protein Q4C10_07875 [Clostridia bacterium]|nr:hypothetical protein [Clostridia bacterium]